MHTAFQAAGHEHDFISKPDFLGNAPGSGAYYSVSVWSYVVLKPLVPLRLLPFVKGSLCSLGDAFKCFPCPALMALDLGAA